MGASLRPCLYKLKSKIKAKYNKPEEQFTAEYFVIISITLGRLSEKILSSRHVTDIRETLISFLAQTLPFITFSSELVLVISTVILRWVRCNPLYIETQNRDVNLKYVKNFPTQCCVGEEEHGASDRILTPARYLSLPPSPLVTHIQ